MRKQQRERELRQAIAYVPQNRLLFSGTIRDNLRMGREDATEAEMMEALQLAEAWEFISQLDRGLDARVEQRGDNFSGGQKQRLAIARALIKQASVHIYDDSFSALDAKTEARLRHNLSALNQDAIVFVVAQRDSTIRNADQILVMQAGNVIEQGTHQELLAQDGFYAGLYRAQFD